MQKYGRASVHEFLGDLIVYRNLVPYDTRLPPLEQFHSEVGIKAGVIPRKIELPYARAMVHLLQQARRLDFPSGHIERLVYLGDTRMLDGLAFRNLCLAGEWRGVAFIAAERNEPLHTEVVPQEGDATLYLSNRWTGLEAFAAYLREQNMPIDEHTTVVIDLDKTAVGARGRNDKMIDEARLEAVRQTVRALIGNEFNRDEFEAAYQRLNQPQFHPFTADNQDYLAYICLILSAGLYDLEALVARVTAGEMSSFTQFIAEVQQRSAQLSRPVQAIHRDIYTRVQEGDPTPFKAFRHNEFRTTLDRFGRLPEGATVEQMLREEIVLTQEVRQFALSCREQGALLFGLSDKPDEASIPTPELAAQGYVPIHRAVTHVIGE